jgi:hypothetical protein
MMDFKDSTYRATSYSDVAGDFVSEGKWSKSGDTIVLEPFKKSIVDSIVILDEQVSSTAFRFINKETNSKLKDVTVVNAGQSYLSDSTGEIVIEKVNGNNVVFTYGTVVDSLPASSIVNRKTAIYVNFQLLKSIKLAPKWHFRGKRFMPLGRSDIILKKCS